MPQVVDKPKVPLTLVYAPEAGGAAIKPPVSPLLPTAGSVPGMDTTMPSVAFTPTAPPWLIPVALLSVGLVVLSMLRARSSGRATGKRRR